MNKLSLIETLRAEAGLTRPEATKVVDLFFNKMATALSNGDRIELRGLCSFFVKEYQSYTGRNPKSGERVTVVPKKLPSFKCGTELKNRVDS